MCRLLGNNSGPAIDSVDFDMTLPITYHLFHTLHTYTTQLTLHSRILNQRTCKGWFPGTKVQMAWPKPLIPEADPYIMKLAIEAQM